MRRTLRVAVGLRARRGRRSRGPAGAGRSPGSSLHSCSQEASASSPRSSSRRVVRQLSRASWSDHRRGRRPVPRAAPVRLPAPHGAPLHAGPSYTIGIEEELMIVDAETLDLVNAIEALLGGRAPRATSSPSSWSRCSRSPRSRARTPREAGAAAARPAHARCATRPRRRGCAHRLGRARTRSRCGRTSGSSRARATATSISALRFVARQELIFGLHVHVGIDDPDKAIHVANGMRVHVPVLLALSAPTRRSGAPTRPACTPRACRSSARSRAWASRPSTRTGPTTSARSASWSSRA